MAVHPSKLHQGDTLADEVREYLGIPKEEFIFRCITRLDKDTSGLVLIAKTLEVAQRLNEQMARREIHREYEAVVYDDKLPDTGTVDAPIARASEDVHDIRRQVDQAKGQRAVTHFTVIERGEGWARVRFRLETGRTHQIRVHMQYIGHSIIGDRLYDTRHELLEAASGLRAVKLELHHPITGETMVVENEHRDQV